MKNITDGFLTYFNSQYQYVKSQMKASRTVWVNLTLGISF